MFGSFHFCSMLLCVATLCCAMGSCHPDVFAKLAASRQCRGLRRQDFGEDDEEEWEDLDNKAFVSLF